MQTVTVKINNMEVQCPSTATILEAARLAGIEIPTLCFLKEINEIGACRMCVVEVKGARTLVAACVYPVTDGMEIFTNTEKVRTSRRMTLELILSNHRKDCLTCVRNQNCELQKLSIDLAVDGIRFADDNLEAQIEASTAHLVRDNSKCILCRRCTAVCKEDQEVAVIGANDRGFDTHIGCAIDRDLGEMGCVSCGQCIVFCPTGALTERDDTAEVYAALADPTKHVIVGTAPAVRVALGECFGMPIGTNVEGKMVASLRRLGFDKVFDVAVSADLTVMEEGTEIIDRLNSGENLPSITSCSPGWVRYCEMYHPEFLPNLSSCKSPQQMFGAMMKTYYAQKMNIDPKDVFVVSIMPCTAKKYEIRRPYQQAVPGLYDVDVVLTTRELGRMIANAGLMFETLPDEEFDPAFGLSTGAGYIFGASGGVMEAALRTVVEKVTGKALDQVDFKEVRGVAGLKEAEYDLNGKKVKVAVVSGLKNAGALLTRIKNGEANYDVIEVMACPGGCVNGGGQPIQTGFTRTFNDLRAIRGAAIYQGEVADRPIRKAHENPLIKEIYETFLGEPGGHKAHEWLHTKYQEQSKYPGLETERKYGK
ncbi:MAG: NADH-dependent [FeFe] hydrogenase, group A6 [Oscillospiraceae bacterium]|nr:NADH-dependent [FeFe] hydrogenase, group A6 [Oscillospiraceae bacterium]